MKRLLISLVIICALLSSSDARRRWVPPPAASGGFLVNQNFEGPGYDNAEAPATSGTIDPDYTGLVLRGSQSCHVSTTNGSYVEWTFTGQTDVWAYCEFQTSSRPTNDGGDIIFQLRDGSSAVAALGYNADDQFKLYANGGFSATSATATANGIHWYCKLHFVSVGTCEVYLSQSAVFTTVDGSGNVYLTKTGAAGTATKLRITNATAGNIVFDHALAQVSEIGDNP